MRRNLAYKALAFTVAWSLVIPFTTFREQNDYIIDFFGSLYKTLFSGIIMKFVLTLQRIRHNCMLACYACYETIQGSVSERLIRADRGVNFD